MVMVKEKVEPAAHARRMMCHTRATSVMSTSAVMSATIPAIRLARRRHMRRSTRSAMAPETIPRKKNGAMRAAEATPTMKAESVISKTSQPKATCSIPMARDCMSVAPQNRRKSR